MAAVTVSLAMVSSVLSHCLQEFVIRKKLVGDYNFGVIVAIK